MMADWIEYTGSDEQIGEMTGARYGVLLGIESRDVVDVSLMGRALESYLSADNIKEYFICNPHPLAEMICQQARTGQQVYIEFPKPGYPAFSRMGDRLVTKVGDNGFSFVSGLVTTEPDWNIPGAQYSFTPFEN